MGRVGDMARRGLDWVCPVEGYTAEQRLRARVLSLATLVIGTLEILNAAYGVSIGRDAPVLPRPALCVGLIFIAIAFSCAAGSGQGQAVGASADCPGDNLQRRVGLR